jgi:dolichol-phosphate mannosyltransferase
MRALRARPHRADLTPPADTTTAPPTGVMRIAAGLRKPGNWLQLIKFGMVGCSGFVINLAVYTVLLHLGVPYLLAAAGAFCVAVLNNFCWNRVWTFRHEARGSHAGFQAARFFVVSVVAFLCNAALLAAFVELGGLGKIVSQLIAVTLVMPLSFLGNKYWSFK